MNTRRARSAALGAALAWLLALTGCTATTEKPDTVKVVAGLYPFAYVAAQVGGSQVTVTNLTKPGAEPHDLELSPKQVAAIVTADLVIYTKGLQPAVDEAIANEAPKRVLEASTVVPMVAFEDHDHEDDDGHDESGLDPHTWLNPENMSAYATAIAEQLSAIDPDRAAQYTRNAAAFSADMSALDTDFSAGLATCQRRVFVTAHAAFGYLADRYEMEQVGISGLNPEEQPSPARLADVQEVARETGVTTIFYETLTSPAVATTIAGDLGLATAVLDPLEGITEESAGTDYPSVMRSNLAALMEANGCS